MAGSQISTSVTILNSLHGFMALSITEYATSAAAAIAAGSVVEIAGAFFTFAGDEAINASSWTSIVTGTTAYITLTASGTAGSQIVDAAYTSTAPAWRDDFQGWYASAASSVRVIGTVYKSESSSYTKKLLYSPPQDSKLQASEIIISGYPASSVYNSTAISVITFPIGTTILCSSNVAKTAGTIIVPYLTTDNYTVVSATTALTGIWASRGWAIVSVGVYYVSAQRIS